MYAGLGPNLLIGVPASGAYFAMNAFILDVCHTHLPQVFDEAGLSMVMAAIAAATSHWIIRTPGEVLKTRAQAERKRAQAIAAQAAAEGREVAVASRWLAPAGGAAKTPAVGAAGRAAGILETELTVPHLLTSFSPLPPFFLLGKGAPPFCLARRNDISSSSVPLRKGR